MKRIIMLCLLASLAINHSYCQSLGFPNLDNIGLIEGLESSPTISFNTIEVDPSVFPAQNELFPEVTSIASGDWDSPSTWDCDCIPSDENSVTIASSHEVTFTSSKEVYTVHIRPDAVLTGLEPGIKLEVKRDLAVYGGLNLLGNNLELDGSEVQRVYGNCIIQKLFLSNSNEIIVEGNLFIEQELWIGDAILTTSDRVYLTAFGGELAQIAPVFGGVINGEVNTSKEILLFEDGFIGLGTSVSNATIQTIVDDFLTAGFEGSDFPNIDFQSVNYYVEESDDNTTDYAPVGSSLDPMVPGRGYYVFAQTGAYVFNDQGVPNVGSVDIAVDYTDNLSPATDGLNLVSNPLLANLNWDSANGWDKENLLGALYVWDASQKQFRTYINGSGINGGTAFIKPMEAFWVMASDANPSLTVNESAKMLHNSETNQAGENMMVSISNELFSDQLVIASNENATESFDSNYDALKFYGDNVVPNICTISEDGVKLAINNLPNLTDVYDIDIMINIPVAGDYNMSINGAEVFLNNRCVVVEDLITGDSYDLTEVDQFSFTSEQVADQVRFVFHLGAPVTAESSAVACTGDATGTILTQGTGEGPWNFSWFDTDMNLIGETLEEAEAFEITGLTAGEYVVQVENNDFCSTLSVPVTVIESPELLQVNHSLWHIGCGDDSTGEILLNLQGGFQPIMVEWDNEMLGANIEELDAGDYTYTVTDGNGCVRTDVVTISEAADVVAGFETDIQAITLDENNEATVMFTNTSTGATSYSWDFGDGFTSSTEESLPHTFTQPGFYTVSMFADNGDCDDYFQTVITVNLHVGITESDLIDLVSIDSNGEEVVISAPSAKNARATVELYDLLGKVLDSKEGILGGEHQLSLSLDQANALYMVSVYNQDTGERTIRKISRF
ncbi:MAG: PKD domain-containing protein [Flavobacteriales bacterium]